MKRKDGKRSNFPRGFPVEQVLEAIKDSRGVVWTVAKRLDCAHITAGKYINKWQATREAMQSETEMQSDRAEMRIHEAIDSEDEGIAVGAAKWYLSKKAKDRGYGESLDLNADVDITGQLVVVRYGDGNKDKNSTPA